MRNVFLLGAALLLGAAVAVAQDHQNTGEKMVKETVDLPTDTKVGAEVLKAGEYKVQCDRETISFRNSDGQVVLKTKCKGPVMSATADHTEIHTSVGDGKTRVLDKLILKGSNIAHEFN